MMNTEKFWNMCNDIIVFIGFLLVKIPHHLNNIRSCHTMEIFLLINILVAHINTFPIISSLATNLELNDQNCSCLFASFSKAKIRCLLPLASFMRVLLLLLLNLGLALKLMKKILTIYGTVYLSNG
jgi:hypothetical protein